MDGFILQDWTTVYGGTNVPSIIQSSVDWVDLTGYRDVVFWLETKAAFNGGTPGLLLSYETAPSKDESLFTLMADAPLLVPSDAPVITKVLPGISAFAVLARWVRWKLWWAPDLTPPSADWGGTFRIHAAARRV